jgi:predicted nucleic acid-binding protein
MPIAAEPIKETTLRERLKQVEIQSADSRTLSENLRAALYGGAAESIAAMAEAAQDSLLDANANMRDLLARLG